MAEFGLNVLTWYVIILSVFGAVGAVLKADLRSAPATLIHIVYYVGAFLFAALTITGG